MEQATCVDTAAAGSSIVGDIGSWPALLALPTVLQSLAANTRALHAVVTRLCWGLADACDGDVTVPAPCSGVEVLHALCSHSAAMCRTVVTCLVSAVTAAEARGGAVYAGISWECVRTVHHGACLAVTELLQSARSSIVTDVLADMGGSVLARVTVRGRSRLRAPATVASLRVVTSLLSRRAWAVW
jgi:hypothetical protein